MIACTVMAVSLAACAKEGPQPRRSDTGSPTLPSASATLHSRTTGQHGPVKAVRALLTKRATALLAGDREGFLAPIDDSAEQLIAGERSFFDNVRGAGPATWTYAVQKRSARKASSEGSDRWTYTVYTSYSLRGLSDQHALARQEVQVVQREGGWRIVSLTPDDEYTEPWDLGKSTSVRGDKIVVVGVGTKNTKLTSIRRLAADAVPRVDDVWTGNWSHGAVIVVPDDAAGAKKLAQAENVSALAAVATGASMTDGSGELHSWDRIVVNPKAWSRMSDTGREVVLAHELTHVATGSLGVVPAWVSEGFADYIGWKGQDLPMSTVAPGLAADVRAAKTPRDLPADEDFSAKDPDQAYEEAWLAAKYIAFRYGEDKLLEFYREMASQSGTTKADQDDALTSTLHVSRSEFRNGWRAYVRARLD